MERTGHVCCISFLLAPDEVAHALIFPPMQCLPFDDLLLHMHSMVSSIIQMPLMALLPYDLHESLWPMCKPRLPDDLIFWHDQLGKQALEFNVLDAIDYQLISSACSHG